MTLIKLLLTGGNADFLFDAIISAAKSSLRFNYLRWWCSEIDHNRNKDEKFTLAKDNLKLCSLKN